MAEILCRRPCKPRARKGIGTRFNFWSRCSRKTGPLISARLNGCCFDLIPSCHLCTGLKLFLSCMCVSALTKLRTQSPFDLFA